MTQAVRSSYVFSVEYRDGENDFSGTFKVYPNGTADQLDAQGQPMPCADPPPPDNPPRFRRREDGRWVWNYGEWPVGVGVRDYLEAAWGQLQTTQRRGATGD